MKPTRWRFYRGGGESAMPACLTRQDVLAYETKELGNSLDIRTDTGMDLPARNLMWLTMRREDAARYGEVKTVDLEQFTIVAADNYGGYLVDITGA
jgi:hypothetical protein